MIDLILIVLVIISLTKPGILVNKKVKEKATEAEVNELASNYRKIFVSFILIIEGLVFTTHSGSILSSIVGLAIAITGIVLAIKFKIKDLVNKNKDMNNSIMSRPYAPTEQPVQQFNIENQFENAQAPQADQTQASGENTQA